MIFPVDGFEYVWSQQIKDFFMYMKESIPEILRDYLRRYKIDDEEKIDWYYEILESSLEIEGIETIEQWREMVTEEWLTEKLSKMVKLYEDDGLKELLNGNILDNYEIMISCEHYYVIHCDYEEDVRKILNI